MKECRYESNGHIVHFLDAGIMTEQPYYPLNDKKDGISHPSVGQFGSNLMTIIRGGRQNNYELNHTDFDSYNPRLKQSLNKHETP